MSATVENRVVSMEFDNKDFERNVATSIQTLDKLDKSLKFDNAGESFDKITQSANKVSLDHIENALDKITSRFTVFGKFVDKMKDKLADKLKGLAESTYKNTLGQISSGGWNRAMNIENAKFQLEGLKIAWDDVYESISYAVDGTAYGLDSAAKAASQLAASGVELGQDMSDSLRAISGVAAMTNSSYDDIAAIFTTVAGQGRVMGDQLNQMASKGLNAAATLAKSFGTTEEELRKMVSKGQVSFKDFAKAMDDAFGEHAKDANKTFEGVLSNIRAALSKIGADFATPIITKMVEPLNVLREAINSVKAAMKDIGVYDVWNDIVEVTARALTSFGNALNQTGIVQNVVQSLFNVFASLINVLMNVGQGIANAFPLITLENVEKLTGHIKDFTNSLVLSRMDAYNLSNTVSGLGSVFNLLGVLIEKAVYILSPVGKIFAEIASVILDVTGRVGYLTTAFVDWLTQSELFNSAVEAMHSAVDVFADNVVSGIGMVVSFLGPKLVTIVDLFLFAVGKIMNVVKDMSIQEVFETAFNKAKEVIKAFTEFLGISEVPIKNFFTSFHFPSFNEAITNIVNCFNMLRTNIGNFVSDFTISGQSIGDIVSNIGNYLYQGAMKVSEFAKAIMNAIDVKEIAKIGVIILVGVLVRTITKAVQDVSEAGVELINATKTVVQPMEQTVKSITGVIDKAGGTIEGVTGVLNAMQTRIKSEALINIAKAIAILAGTIGVLIVTLTVIPEEELTKALGASLVIVGELVALLAMSAILFAVIAKVDGEESANAMLHLAESLGILALAVYLMGNMGLLDMAQGLGAIAVLLLEVGIYLKKMEKVAPPAAANILVLSLALDALMPLVMQFGSYDAGQIAGVLVGIGGILAEIGTFCVALQHFKVDVGKQVLAIMGLVTALNMLLPAIIVFGVVMDANQLDQALGVFTVLMAELGTFAVVVNGAELISAGVGLMALAAAIDLLIPPLLVFGYLPWEVWTAGLLGIGAALLVLGGATYILAPLSPVILAIGGAFLMMAAAVDLTIVGIGLLGPALVSLSVGLLAINATGKIVGKEFGENVSNIIIGLAQAIQKAAPETARAVVAMLSSWIAAIAEAAPQIAANVLQILVTIAYTIGAGIPLVIGAVIAGVGSALATMADSESEFNQKTGGIMAIIIASIKEGAKLAWQAFKDLVKGGINALEEKVNDFFEWGKSVVDWIIDGIKSMIDGVVTAGKNIVAGLKSALVGGQSEINTAGEELGQAGVDGVNKGAGCASPSKKSAETGENIVKGLVNGIEENSDDANDAGSKLGTTTINGLNSDDVTGNASKAGKSIFGTFLDGLREDIDKAAVAGNDFTSGFFNGISELTDNAVNAAKGLGNKAIEALKDAIDAHSDSRITTGSGNDYSHGFGVGIEEMTDFVAGKASDLGDTAIDTLVDKVADSTGIKDAAEGMIDNFAGTITGGIPDVEGAVTNLTGNMSTTLQNTMPDGEATGGGFGSGVFGGISNWIPDIENVTGNIKGLMGNYDAGAVAGSYNQGYTQGEQYYYGMASWEGPIAQLASRFKSYLSEALEAYERAKKIVGTTANVIQEQKKLLGKDQYSYTYKGFMGKQAKALEEYQDKINSGFGTMARLEKQLAALESQAIKTDDAVAAVGSGSAGGGGGGGSGGSGGSGGGGGSSATKEKEEEIKELFDVMEDAEGVVNAYAQRFVQLDEDMEESDGIDKAKERIDAFADSILVLSDDYTKELSEMDKSSEEYLEAMQKAWDTYHDNLEKAITGSIDAFSEFKYTAETDADTIVKSINSQTEALNLFDRTVAVLAQDANISPQLLEELVNGGVSSLDKLVALLDTTEEKRKTISESYDTLHDVETSVTDRIMASLAASVDNYSDAVEKALEDSDEFQNAMDKMSKSSEETQLTMYYTFKDTYNKLDDIIDLGKNIWVEYEDAEKKSKKALMKNLDEQTKQWQAWADGLNEVIAKGLDEAVVKNLMNMGLDAMPYIRGFKDMTEEEMSDYNEKFTGLATIKQTMQAELAGNYTAVAKNIVDSFKDGIDTSAAEESGKELVDNTVNAIQEALGDKAKYQGTILATAYDEGFKENSDFVQDTVKQFSEDLLQNLEIDYNDLHDIGKNIMEGLADGLEDNADIVTDKLSDLVDDMISEVEDGFDIGSPSKVMRRLGQFIDQGLAMGVDDESKGVISSIKDMGNDAYQSMKAIVDYILDILNGETKADLTLTPVLDLDEFYTGIDDMNGMLQTTSKNNLREASRISPYYSTGQYGVNGNTTNNSNTININVYGDGMNASEIADEVQNRINHQIRRLGAVS